MAPVRREYIQSAFLSKPLSNAAWAALSDGVMSLGVNGSVGMNAMGGKWREGPTDKTSYPHRGFLFNLEINTVWYDERLDDKVKSWTNAAYCEHVLPACGGKDCQVYCNYPDGLLDGKGSAPDFTTAYWANNLERLKVLKAELDPDDLFAFPQSIPTVKDEL